MVGRSRGPLRPQKMRDDLGVQRDGDGVRPVGGGVGAAAAAVVGVLLPGFAVQYCWDVENGPPVHVHVDAGGGGGEVGVDGSLPEKGGPGHLGDGLVHLHLGEGRGGWAGGEEEQEGGDKTETDHVRESHGNVDMIHFLDSATLEILTKFFSWGNSLSWG